MIPRQPNGFEGPDMNTFFIRELKAQQDSLQKDLGAAREKLTRVEAEVAGLKGQIQEYVSALGRIRAYTAGGNDSSGLVIAGKKYDYPCPYCFAHTGTAREMIPIDPLYEDRRTDYFRCRECGNEFSVW